MKDEFQEFFLQVDNKVYETVSNISNITAAQQYRASLCFTKNTIVISVKITAKRKDPKRRSMDYIIVV